MNERLIYEAHVDCYLCTVCGNHTEPAEQWPCAHCSELLCPTCHCPNDHHTEACS